jgi:hypothetical protein
LAWATLWLGLGLPGLAGCGDEPPGTEWPVAVQWAFADGRGCQEAGVSTVAVGPPGSQTPTRLECGAGLGEPVPAGTAVRGPLTVEGLTPGGLPLYRAVTEMPDRPAALAVTLVFVGGAMLP